MAEVEEDLWSKPSEARSGDGTRLSDYTDSLVIIKGKEFREIPTSFGEKEAAIADLWIVGDDNESAPQGSETLIFNGAIIGTVKRAFENQRPIVVGVVAQGTPKPGQQPPLILEDPTDDEFNEAVAWFKKKTAKTRPARAEKEEGTSRRRRPEAAAASSGDDTDDAPF